MKFFTLNFFSILLFTSFIFAQSISQNPGVYVDNKGVMHWQSDNSEVSLFGVNYTTPFAYSYRAMKRLNLDLKKAIDLDVAQFKRLGLDAFRVHMWDREISDSIGNVTQNEHLDLFDYLLAKLAENGIKTIITPIAWWGTAWPEPDYKTPGFSDSYSKVEMITDPKARAAQRNYLKQIINHVNPYTKFSYKNDPSIIAVEIINEPHHPSDTAQVTNYINEMFDVLRNEGLTKPIFYNISETWSNEQANAVARSKVQGVSFQWYPTGLVHNKRLEENYLINVNKYTIPSDSIIGFNEKAKMVYEFDAADIGESYLYPAMIRSYREAGMQFATMFAYDPSQIAWSNTEYSTHFLNLLYAPQKAIGLMIAAKAFHELPRYKSFGNYPENNLFGNFRVSYKENLSELKSKTEFYYTNNTLTKSVEGVLLKQIAGTGNSIIVQYNGTGAYFLDKLQDGIWKLEVYPDVLWIDDPFGRASMSRQAAKLFWNEREMKINLPDLGTDYSVAELSGNGNVPDAEQSEIKIEPGIYLLTSSKIKKAEIPKTLLKPVKFLDELYIPPETTTELYVVNKTPEYMPESKQGDFEFEIGGEKISGADLYVRRLGWRGFEKHPLENTNGFTYSISDSSKILNSGIVEYCIAVESNGKTFTYPEGVETKPGNWDFYSTKFWTAKILKSKEPVVLFDPLRDKDDFVFTPYSRDKRFTLDYKNGSNSESNSVAVNVTFGDADTIPFALQLNAADLIKPLKNNLKNYRNLVVRARAVKDKSGFSLNLMTHDGGSYNSDKINLISDWQNIEIPLDTFKPGRSLILPFSYPHFLPKYWQNRGPENINIDELNFIQILSSKSDAVQNGDMYETGFEIESIYLK